MKIYWTLKSIPELAQLSVGDRGRVWRKFSSKAFRHWQTWLALIVLMGVTGGAVLLTTTSDLGTYLSAWLPAGWGTPAIKGGIGGMIGGGLGGFIYGQVVTSIVSKNYITPESVAKALQG